MLILTKYRTCHFWYTLVYVVFPLKALFSSKASPWTWLYVLIMKCVSNFILTLLADATQILYPCMQCADIFFLKASIYRAIAFLGIPKEILLNSLWVLKGFWYFHSECIYSLINEDWKAFDISEWCAPSI